jgi:hypothetical protein
VEASETAVRLRPLPPSHLRCYGGQVAGFGETDFA